MSNLLIGVRSNVYEKIYVDGSSVIEITVFPLGMILAKGPSKDR